MRIILFTIFYCISFTISSQSLKDSIIKYTSEVRTISPDDEEFSDLEPIGEVLKNKRIVFLGEQGHKDGAAFEAKTRLIKYLHSKHNFDVLVFESDFYNLNLGWDENKSIEQLKKSIYTFWTTCSNADELFEYLEEQRQTKNPLILSGYDVRHKRVLTKKYIDDLKSLLNDLNFTKDENYKEFISSILITLQKEYNTKLKKKKRSFCLTYIDSIANSLAESSIENKFFWQQEIKNLRAFLLNAWYFFNNNEYSGERDRQMADNLSWLLEKKYPNKKIIVWTHNGHFERGGYNPNKKAFKYIKVAGQYIHEKYKEQVYTVGFISYDGISQGDGDLKNYKIPSPKKKSLENLINTKNINYGFIDFQKLAPFHETKIYLKGVSHLNENKKWFKRYDGVFYIKNMYPCEENDFLLKDSNN
ncbi:erythromycin esterase family protein [Aureivirga sp. CE67]|uniref:erythromycin esterase family protein n=1 Tax=Aureivirga sp. CE67 TaxID=1788983 RepID=UPI0018CBD727|nr:erythromycin esterase family protein [Aureivirga sp. CE67]